MRRYVALLRGAAGLGNPEAQENLAAWMLEGLRDEGGWILRRSPKQALPLLVAASDAGNPLATFSLANCHADGIGVRRNVEIARTHYLRAYRRGIGLAALNLSVLYRNTGNQRGEMRWLRRAALAGEDDAVVEVARRARGRFDVDIRRRLQRIARRGPEDLRQAARVLLRRAVG